MRRYLHFLLIGLLLGLFTEVQLKLVAGINPPAFLIALAAYPVILSLFYVLSRLIDRWVATGWNGDLLHYALAGFGGLAVEWTLLGNGGRPTISFAFRNRPAEESDVCGYGISHPAE